MIQSSGHLPLRLMASTFYSAVRQGAMYCASYSSLSWVIFWSLVTFSAHCILL